MNTSFRALLLALAFGASNLALAAPSASAPGPAQGWTGLSKPADVIRARGALMEQMEVLMQPIDTITIKTGAVHDADQLRRNAEVVSAILTAVPHLFPPTTNLYDPKSTTPPTIALPAIWQNFDAFFQLAAAASKTAGRLAKTKGDDAMRKASLELRASCDACHAVFLRKYESPKAQAADDQFDFDSALGKKK